MQTYNPTLLEKGLRSLFFNDFLSAQSMIWVDKVANIVDSKANNEKYAWAGPSPSMSQFLDEQQFTPLTDTGYTLTNNTYSAGLAVSRAQIEDDQLNGIRMRIAQMAATAAGHRNEIISDLLVNGTTDLCYDNESFFGDAHLARADEGATQDNLLAGTGTTTAQVQTDLTTGIATIMGFTGENGEPVVENPTRWAVVAPPELLGAMQEALKARDVVDTTNVRFAGMTFDVIFDPRLSDADDWYLLYTGGGIKPLIFQDRSPLEFTALEKDSDSGFRREQYLYKVRARYVGGYALWQYAVKMVN